jgi:hypothetical protein
VTTRLLEWYGTLTQNKKYSPMKNGIKDMFKCGNCGSISSVTNAPFMGGSDGAMLIRIPIIQVGENIRIPLEVSLAMS